MQNGHNDRVMLLPALFPFSWGLLLLTAAELGTGDTHDVHCMVMHTRCTGKHKSSLGSMRIEVSKWRGKKRVTAAESDGQEMTGFANCLRERWRSCTATLTDSHSNLGRNSSTLQYNRPFNGS